MKLKDLNFKKYSKYPYEMAMVSFPRQPQCDVSRKERD
jgi:hypothetical protein